MTLEPNKPNLDTLFRSISVIPFGPFPDMSYPNALRRIETLFVQNPSIRKEESDTKSDFIELELPKDEGTWFVSQLNKLKVSSLPRPTMADLKTDFEERLEDFELFWYSKSLLELRDLGLLLS